MGAIVFGNEFFDQWLNQKSNEILGKVEREKITTEEMLILSLKAQVNHFHHMDVEFREEFRRIDKRFEKIEHKFEKIDDRFEQLYKVLTWGFGLLFSSILAIGLKLFL
ncbi:MAG: hypothetical protein JNM93_06700 [Bacteriovoracaceae bacterium]|nr:hypothetical protein [Bacteriovoracaceae bacterium]